MIDVTYLKENSFQKITSKKKDKPGVCIRDKLSDPGRLLREAMEFPELHLFLFNLNPPLPPICDVSRDPLGSLEKPINDTLSSR